MAINDRLTKFEKLARNLVEGSFDRPLGQQKLVREMARQIASAVERSAVVDGPAPSYSIHLHHDTLEELLQASPELPHLLNKYLLEITLEYDLGPPGAARVKLVPDEQTTQDQVFVRADSGELLRENTVKGDLLEDVQDQKAIKKTDAFLILDGKRHIQLRRPLVTIGRHLESDIVLEDPSVSRQHAQLRWRYGRYMILDLGSKAGTLVNNRSIAQCLLKNGDVIKLGQTSLIYGEEMLADEIQISQAPVRDGSTRQLPRLDLE